MSVITKEPLMWKTWAVVRGFYPFRIAPIDIIDGEVYGGNMYIELKPEITIDELKTDEYVVGEFYQITDEIIDFVFYKCADCILENDMSLEEYLKIIYDKAKENGL